MDTRYDIYFAGQVLEGQDAAKVRLQLGKVFNANEQTLEKLFSGKAQLLKRGCDRETALKYKQAMESAGAKAIVKKSEPAAATPPPQSGQPPAPSKDETPTQAAPMTAAERIAAMAAAPDKGNYTAAPEEPKPAATPQASAQDAATATGAIDLAPAGTEVLREDERQSSTAAIIDTSALSVDDAGPRLSAETAAAPPPPVTDHLHMGEVGESIPNLPSHETALDPNTDELDLSPQGTDFSDCTPPPAVVPELDLSGLDVAPSGSAVLEDKYRNKPQPDAPPVDHITLED